MKAEQIVHFEQTIVFEVNNVTPTHKGGSSTCRLAQGVKQLQTYDSHLAAKPQSEAFQTEPGYDPHT